MSLSARFTWRSFQAGAWRMVLPGLASFPFGIGFGVAAAQKGLSIFETTLMSVTVFAGTSQMVALEFLADTSWAAGLIDGAEVAAVAPAFEEPVPYAPSADVLLVPEGDSLVAIDLSHHQPEAEPAMDLTRTVGWVRSGALADAPREVVGGRDELEHYLDVAAVGN